MFPEQAGQPWDRFRWRYESRENGPEYDIHSRRDLCLDLYKAIEPYLLYECVITYSALKKRGALSPFVPMYIV